MKRNAPALFCLAVTMLAAACAVEPLTPISKTNPASSEASEAPVAVLRNALGSDAATEKSKSLLDAAEKGNLHSPGSQPGDMSGMNMGDSHAGH